MEGFGFSWRWMLCIKWFMGGLVGLRVIGTSQVRVLSIFVGGSYPAAW